MNHNHNDVVEKIDILTAHILDSMMYITRNWKTGVSYTDVENMSKGFAPLLEQLAQLKIAYSPTPSSFIIED